MALIQPCFRIADEDLADWLRQAHPHPGPERDGLNEQLSSLGVISPLKKFDDIADAGLHLREDYQQLPVSERGSVMILASNYGEAGALQYYGNGLPGVVCAHLTYYYWAPAQMAPSTLIVVGYPRDYLIALFGSAEPVATISNSYGIRNEEFGNGIWIVRNHA